MSNKGFTLIETLVSLWVVSFSLVLLGSLVMIISKEDFRLYQQEDYAFLHQIRMIYALSVNIELEDDMLHFRYKGDDMYYEKYQDKLILKEGYQVFLNDVEEIRFEKKEKCHYLIYKRAKKENTHIIGCE